MKSQFRWAKYYAVLLFAAITLSTGCGGGGGGGDGSNTTTTMEVASVSGRILDSSGNPLADVLIRVTSDPIETRTDSEGRFSFSVEAGRHQLTASRDGIVLNVMCFTAAEGTRYEMGDIGPDAPSGCTVPEPTAGDADGDGLADDVETAGWTVIITQGDGTMETRQVQSDPAFFDSDADGLNDAQELAARTDPMRSDSDGDLLSDYAELYVYKSQPTMVDSDGDSCRPDSGAESCESDPNLWDGYELTLAHTSPTLADTDGDGFSDYKEINTGGTNPRRANLPSLALELTGDPLIELEVDYTTGSSSRSESLEREETDRTKTDTESTKMSIENTIDIKTHSKVGTSAWPPSFNATIDTETKFQHGYFHNTSSSWKHSSVSQSQENYKNWEESSVSFDDGKISVAMKVVNQSDLSFKLKDLRVVAFRQTGGGRFSLIGTMAPDKEWPEEGFVLGPSAELTMTMSKEHIGAEVMKALVRDPTALMFEVGAYSLFQLDEFGVTETVNYAKLGEAVLQRTGLIVIDYGNGRVEQHMVATNVYRNADGSGRGLNLREALQGILNQDYETQIEVNTEGEEGKQVLYRIKDTAAYDVCNEASGDRYDPTADCENLHKQGFWLVAGSGEDFRPGKEVDFDAIRLHNGERITLVYLNDTDGDGIFDREEYLLGTNRNDPDTDVDGLSDFQETREGWEVAVAGLSPYKVFPDPRFADLDDDFMSDNTEFNIGTDPYLVNTDGDDLTDTTDPFPLSPPCLAGDKLGLVAWWDGSIFSGGSTGFMAEDIWTKEAGGIASDGEMFPGDLTLAVLDNTVFQFNSLPDQNDSHIDVADQDDDGLSPTREFSLSTWVYWEGAGTGKDQGAILTKGTTDHATYGLYLLADGRLKFTLHRNYHRKCWGWFFGWVDDLCRDDNLNETVELVSDDPIPVQEFVDVTATFSGEKLRLYVDGIPLQPVRSTWSGTWTSGNLKYQRQYTNYLVANDEPLRMGGEYNAAALLNLPFRGLLDNVQVFARGLNDDEVSQKNNIGVCTPP